MHAKEHARNKSKGPRNATGTSNYLAAVHVFCPRLIINFLCTNQQGASSHLCNPRHVDWRTAANTGGAGARPGSRRCKRHHYSFYLGYALASVSLSNTVSVKRWLQRSGDFSDRTCVAWLSWLTFEVLVSSPSTTIRIFGLGSSTAADEMLVTYGSSESLTACNNSPAYFPARANFTATKQLLLAFYCATWLLSQRNGHKKDLRLCEHLYSLHTSAQWKAITFGSKQA